MRLFNYAWGFKAMFMNCSFSHYHTYFDLVAKKYTVYSKNNRIVHFFTEHLVYLLLQRLLIVLTDIVAGVCAHACRCVLGELCAIRRDSHEDSLERLQICVL